MTSRDDQLLADIHDLSGSERDGIRGLAEQIGPAEWADLVPQLEPAEVAVLLQWLPDEEVPLLLEELVPAQAAAILRTLSRNEAAGLLQEMDPDDAADVVEQLPDHEARDILVRMRAADASEIRDLAAYPTDTAGGLMTPAFVAVSRDATATEAIAAIRRLVEDAETVSYIYVTDEERRSRGAVALSPAPEPG
jgi:Mg/Co/Ni transporter MgtE